MASFFRIQSQQGFGFKNNVSIIYLSQSFTDPEAKHSKERSNCRSPSIPCITLCSHSDGTHKIWLHLTAVAESPAL